VSKTQPLLLEPVRQPPLLEIGIIRRPLRKVSGLLVKRKEEAEAKIALASAR